MKLAPELVITDMSARLAKAAAAVEDARSSLRDELALRDQLVVAAVDQGMGLRATARAVRLTSARVVAILAGSQTGDDS